MTNKILNQAQAEAVYIAMFALNNVSGRVSVNIGDVYVTENMDGEVCAERDLGRGGCERYASQSAFATAYSLQQDDDGTSSYSGMFGTSGNMPHPRP